MAKMPQIAITTVNTLFCDRHRHVELLRIFYCIFTSFDVPLPPWRHYLQFRVESKEGQLKANLRHSRFRQTLAEHSKELAHVKELPQLFVLVSILQKLQQSVRNTQSTCYHLIIAFSCASMGDSISSDFPGNIYHGLYFFQSVIVWPRMFQLRRVSVQTHSAMGICTFAMMGRAIDVPRRYFLS